MVWLETSALPVWMLIAGFGAVSPHCYMVKYHLNSPYTSVLWWWWPCVEGYFKKSGYYLHVIWLYLKLILKWDRSLSCSHLRKNTMECSHSPLMDPRMKASAASANGSSLHLKNCAWKLVGQIGPRTPLLIDYPKCVRVNTPIYSCSGHCICHTIGDSWNITWQSQLFSNIHRSFKSMLQRDCTPYRLLVYATAVWLLSCGITDTPASSFKKNYIAMLQPGAPGNFLCTSCSQS